MVIPREGRIEWATAECRQWYGEGRGIDCIRHKGAGVVNNRKRLVMPALVG